MQALIDAYQITEDGKVFSLDREESFYSKRHNKIQTRIRKGRELKLALNREGYLQVGIFNNGNVKRCLVHRLVALAYIPNPNGYKEVNHKDGDKTNNHVSNLEWSTRRDNSLHSARILKKNIGSQNRASKLIEAEVKEISELLKILTIKDIAFLYGVTYDCIWRISKGYNWSHITNIRKEGINASTH